MHFINEDILRIAMRQSAIDANCRADDFMKTENVVVTSVTNPNARKYLTNDGKERGFCRENERRETDMKCYPQVYVMNSLEAVETYCKAFGAEVTFAIKNAAGTAYEHCELSVDGEPILAAAEAAEPYAKPYDVSVIHRLK